MVLLLLMEVICSVSRRCLHCVLVLVSRKSFHFSRSLQSGDILLLLRSVLQSSAVEALVEGSCYQCPQSLVSDYRGMPEMMVKTKCKLNRVLKKRLVPIALLEFESQSQEKRQTPQS